MSPHEGPPRMKKVPVRLQNGKTTEGFRKVGSNKTHKIQNHKNSSALSKAVNQMAHTTLTLADQPVPTLSFEKVFHVGTLNPHLKGTHYKESYEGIGLSVSVHPEEWRSIAKLGDAPTWKITKEHNNFLDRWDLTVEQEQAIEKWGVKNGLLEEVPRWEVTQWDSENEKEYRFHCDSLEEALEESGDDPKTVKEVFVFVTTEELSKKSGCAAGNTSNAFDLTLIEHTRQQNGFDGVWWEDDYDPISYSCPRGVIFKETTSSWTFVNADKLL